MKVKMIMKNRSRRLRRRHKHKYIKFTVTYPSRLGDRYTGLEAQTLAPKKHFSRFLFFGFASIKNMLK